MLTDVFDKFIETCEGLPISLRGYSRTQVFGARQEHFVFEIPHTADAEGICEFIAAAMTKELRLTHSPRIDRSLVGDRWVVSAVLSHPLVVPLAA